MGKQRSLDANQPYQSSLRGKRGERFFRNQSVNHTDRRALFRHTQTHNMFDPQSAMLIAACTDQQLLLCLLDSRRDPMDYLVT